jgi:hypothetical protein
MPEFITMHRMYRKRNFQMVTISMDELEQKDAALKTLRENHASTTNYIAAVKDRDQLADMLDKEWRGPVPYTLLIAPGGKVIYRHSGPIEPLEVRRKIADTIGRTYANRASSPPLPRRDPRRSAGYNAPPARFSPPRPIRRATIRGVWPGWH